MVGNVTSRSFAAAVHKLLRVNIQLYIFNFTAVFAHKMVMRCKHSLKVVCTARVFKASYFASFAKLVKVAVDGSAAYFRILFRDIGVYLVGCWMVLHLFHRIQRKPFLKGFSCLHIDFPDVFLQKVYYSLVLCYHYT